MAFRFKNLAADRAMSKPSTAGLTPAVRLPVPERLRLQEPPARFPTAVAIA
jgi:hypothetical protein